MPGGGVSNRAAINVPLAGQKAAAAPDGSTSSSLLMVIAAI